ncbi:MAG: hypothetical protein ACI857_001161 [Arenicella sp.]|jgi:hypothetical protein
MKHYALLLLMILALALASSCKKYDEGDDTCPACPRIEYLEPYHAKGGEILTIHGSNFNPDFSANIIQINGVQVAIDSILSGDTEMIRAFVPLKCGTGLVTVDVDDELDFSGPAPTFTYDFIYTVSHYAGSMIGENGLENGIDTFPRFFSPSAMVIDNNDNLFVSDWTMDYTEALIRKVNPVTNLDGESMGEVATVNISPIITYIADMIIDQNTNQLYFVGDLNLGSLYRGGANQNPVISTPLNPTENISRNIFSIEKVGNKIYAYDNLALKILVLDELSAFGQFTDFIGTGEDTSIDGDSTTATIGFGTGFASDVNGDLYFTELDPFHKIRKIDLNSSTVNTVSGIEGVNSVVDGPLDACTYQNPRDLVFDDNGVVYFSDYNSKGVRMIKSGEVTTIAGSEAYGFQNGDGLDATFDFINDIVIDSQSNLFVLTNSAIRKITIE